MLGKLRGILYSDLSTDGQKHGETSHFGENSNNGKNGHFFLLSPPSSYNCDSQLDPGHALALPVQRRAADIPTIPDPWHRLQ